MRSLPSAVAPCPPPPPPGLFPFLRPALHPFCTYATSTLGRFTRRNAARAGEIALENRIRAKRDVRDRSRWRRSFLPPGKARYRADDVTSAAMTFRLSGNCESAALPSGEKLFFPVDKVTHRRELARNSLM